MTSLIRQHFQRAAVRMKHQADKHRSERQFPVGDSIFLRLQSCVQSSLAPRSNQKLSFKYFGPFVVLERIGQVAYRLDFLAGSQLHPVFHVSRLKQAVIEGTQVMPSLPVEFSALQVPEKILQRRVVTRGLRYVHQVLIR
jgi:hypothetical protein